MNLRLLLFLPALVAGAVCLPGCSKEPCESGTGPGCLSNTSTTILSDDPDPSVVGQAVTVRFRVAATGGAPTGRVTVSDGETSCTAGVQDQSCTVSPANAGSRTFQATYSGDSRFKSSSTSTPHEVNKALTVTALDSVAPSPSAVGRPVDVYLSVSVQAPGQGTLTGQVSVSDGVDSCSVGLGQGPCALILTTAGMRTLTATYSGDPNFEPSSNSSLHSVIGGTTTTVDSTLPHPSVVGQPVTVQFSVTAAGGSPAGAVEVTVSGASGARCSGAAAAGSCVITFSEAGPKTLTATYPGNDNFDPSSGMGSHQVDRASTQTMIDSLKPAASVVGQPVEVFFSHSVVPPGSGAPTGMVAVSDGNTSCTAPVTAGSCTLIPVTAGSKTISADYPGDANFQGSSGNTGHSVGQAATTTLIDSVSPAQSVVGQPVTLSYRVMVVAPGGGGPSGQVTVTAGSISCSGPAPQGSCVLALTRAGPTTFSADYPGDANFQASAVSASHQVNMAQTSVTIDSVAPAPSVVGRTVIVGYQINVLPPGAGAPTGQVTVSDGTASCSAPVATRSCSLQPTALGTRPLTANYPGDSDFQPSSTFVSHKDICSGCESRDTRASHGSRRDSTSSAGVQMARR